MNAIILQALKTGMKYGVWLFAVWHKEGQETCGIMKTPLKEVYNRINKGDYNKELSDNFENQKTLDLLEKE